jgi:general secretion pathway protein D
MTHSRQLVFLLAVGLATGSFAQAQQIAQVQPPPADKAADKTADKPISEHQRSEAAKAYAEGAKALEHQDLKTADKDFERAVKLDPTNQQYQASREIVLQGLATERIHDAEKARILGHPDQASADLIEAYKLAPSNPMLAQHLDELANDITHTSTPAPAQFSPESENIAPPIELLPELQKRSFHLRAGTNEVLRQVLSSYGIAPTFDSSVKGQNIRFDIDDVDFADAQRMVTLATNTFFVPLDPKRVLIAADTKENRTKFERMSAETIYFPGFSSANEKDAEALKNFGEIAKNVFDAQQAVISDAHSTLTVRAPSSRLPALNVTLNEMLEGRSEVQLEVRLYNIAKTRTQNLGLQLPQQTTVFNVPSQLNGILSQNESLVQQIISSGLAASNDPAAIALALLASGQISGSGSSVLSQPFALFGGGLTLSGLQPGSVTGNFALNSSDSRALDHITLGVLDQEEATIKSGTRYPIVTSTYSNLATTSINVPGLSSAGLSSQLSSLGINASALNNSASQVIPQVQYQDLGLTFTVTPRVQKDHDITLKLDFKIDSLSGASLNNIPVLDNQEYKADITLREGAMAMVASTLSKTQSSAVTGVPGLSALPGFQSATNNSTENDVSELVILITPHVVRLTHQQEAGQMIILPIH